MEVIRHSVERFFQGARTNVNTAYQNTQLNKYHQRIENALNAVESLRDAHYKLAWDVKRRAMPFINKFHQKFYRYIQHRFSVPESAEISSIEVFRHKYDKGITEYLQQQLTTLGNLKGWSGLKVEGTNTRDQREEDRRFSVGNQTIRQPHEIKAFLNTIFEGFQSQMDGMSYWEPRRIKYLDLHMMKYNPLNGSSYLKAPAYISAKKCVVNVKNDDALCFLYALDAKLFPQAIHPERPSHYRKTIKRYDITGIEFPMEPRDIERFEAQNKKHLRGYTIDLYYTDDDPDSLKSLRVNPDRKVKDRIQLLLYKNDENQRGHYMLIKDWSAFVNKQGQHTWVCPCCMTRLKNPDKTAFDKHLARCVELGGVRVVMPEEGSHMYFKNHHHENKHPLVAYADFESKNIRKGGKIVQVPVSWAILLAVKDGVRLEGLEDIATYTGSTRPESKTIFEGSWFKHIPNQRWFYYFQKDGMPDAGQVFLDTMKAISMCFSYTAHHHFQDYPDWKDIVWKEGEKQAHAKAKECKYCFAPFKIGDYNLRKVADHDHLTGEYRGALHSACNLKAGRQETRYFIPVVFHNLKGYDAHHILSAVSKDEANKDGMSVIAETGEKYKTFSIYPDARIEWVDDEGQPRSRKTVPLKFIDSYAFISESLGTILETLNKNPNAVQLGRSSFKDITKEGKGALPYDQPWHLRENLDRTSLYPIEWFDSTLSGKMKTSEYNKLQRIWKEEGLETCHHFHDLYLRMDVGGLHDMFETFRDLCLEKDGLDPVYYTGLPSFSLDSALKMTKARIELLTDEEMYLMFEKQKRGGISVQTHRYAKTEGNTHIKAFDANNLYGCTMTQPLPIRGFKWIPKDELWNFKDNATYEVWIHTPDQLHDTWDEYPICEKMIIEEKHLNETHRHLLGTNTFTPCVKLCGTLSDKDKYVINGKLLKYYIAKGHEVKAVYRGIEYEEEAWLKPYIEFNNLMRSKTSVEFERNIYKMKNNSVFGKTMEDVRKYQNFNLVKSDRLFRKYTERPDFKSLVCYGGDDPHLFGMWSNKTEIYLNKPIYLGTTILDLSKLHMTRLHYDVMKAQFGTRCKLLMSDTDSLVYEIVSEDLNAELQSIEQHFDFSNLKVSAEDARKKCLSVEGWELRDETYFHPLYDPKRKDHLGLFKDDVKGRIIAEFVGLRAKMYAFRFADGRTWDFDDREDHEEEPEEKLILKGIPKYVKKTQLKFSNYKETLMTRTAGLKVAFHTLTSKNHEIHLNPMSKLTTSAYDDKRWILEDGITTRAHGNYLNV